MAKEGIGKEFTGIAVCFACHDGDGNFLLAKRSKNARDEQDRWEFTAGGIKFGEQAEEAVSREVREELCAEVLEFQFIGYRDMMRFHDGVSTHWIALDFIVRVNPLQVRVGEPHKCDGLKWMTLKQIESFNEPLHSQFPIFLNKYRDQLSRI